MKEHRYILEPYKGMSTRYHCPNCNSKEKTFVCYIDTETDEHIATNVGRCNRESNCGYHYTPKQYFQDNNISFFTFPTKSYSKKKTIIHLPKPPSFIPVDVFKASLKYYNSNHFVKFLISLFGVKVTTQLISRYFIGTSKNWNGATVYWQIDIQGKIRTGKIMLYNAITGKRVKEPFNHITWVHAVQNITGFELKQCLFGEHLLKDKIKPIAIVESEKTAVIASVYLPQFIWLAVGSLTNFNAGICQVLKQRSVTLFPDLKGFEKWNAKANELLTVTRFSISDLLERKATKAEKNQGLDLADFLIRFDCKKLVHIRPDRDPITQSLQQLVDKPTEPDNNINKPACWNQDINELQKYFEGIVLPTQPIKLNDCTTVTDISLFIESHFAFARANNGKETFKPYIEMLKQLKECLLKKNIE